MPLIGLNMLRRFPYCFSAHLRSTLMQKLHIKVTNQVLMVEKLKPSVIGELANNSGIDTLAGEKV